MHRNTPHPLALSLTNSSFQKLSGNTRTCRAERTVQPSHGTYLGAGGGVEEGLPFSGVPVSEVPLSEPSLLSVERRRPLPGVITVNSLATKRPLLTSPGPATRS